MTRWPRNSRIVRVMCSMWTGREHDISASVGSLALVVLPLTSLGMQMPASASDARSSKKSTMYTESPSERLFLGESRDYGRSLGRRVPVRYLLRGLRVGFRKALLRACSSANFSRFVANRRKMRGHCSS